MRQPLSGRDFAEIRARGEAPSRLTARQVRDDYVALTGEVSRLRYERSQLRSDLARLKLGEITAEELLAGLDLTPEIEEIAAQRSKDDFARLVEAREHAQWRLG